MKFRKWPRSRPARAATVEDEGDEDSARGGYVIRVDTEELPLILAEPIQNMRSEELSVSASAQALEPGAYCLLGGPGESTCEVVQVAEGEEPPGESRRIRRGMLRTIASPHPAGAKVTLVTAVWIEDWEKRDAQVSAEGRSAPQDHAEHDSG